MKYFPQYLKGTEIITIHPNTFYSLLNYILYEQNLGPSWIGAVSQALLLCHRWCLNSPILTKLPVLDSQGGCISYWVTPISNRRLKHCLSPLPDEYFNILDWENGARCSNYRYLSSIACVGLNVALNNSSMARKTSSKPVIWSLSLKALASVTREKKNINFTLKSEITNFKRRHNIVFQFMWSIYLFYTFLSADLKSCGFNLYYQLSNSLGSGFRAQSFASPHKW